MPLWFYKAVVFFYCCPGKKKWLLLLVLLHGLLLPGMAQRVVLPAGGLGGEPAVATDSRFGGPCPPVAGLYPWPDSNSVAPVARFLARAVAMNGLTDENLPMPVPWNRTLDGRPCYTGGPPYDPSSYVDSLSCAGLCTFVYCPANFAADVALLVQLKASFVQFAASTWDRPDRFTPGSDYLKAAAETVTRINSAFDCAGLPRPYIQASVLENVDESRTCAPPEIPCEDWMRPGPPGTNSGVKDVPILPVIIEEFRDEIRRSPSDSIYYLDATGQPRTNLHYSFSRLAYFFQGEDYSPDATRLEGRMWLYYMATCYIDRGYTSLHMGQPKVWGKLHLVSAAERPQALQRVAVLLNRIRRYARTRDNQLLLLTAEPMTDTATGAQKEVLLADGVDEQGRTRLLFDFSMAAMRPRETSPQLDEQANPSPGFRCPAIDPLALAGTACADLPLATIDPCHGINMGPDGGGITPLGFVYTQSPYTIYFDHGETIARLPDKSLAPTGVLWPGNDKVWGWDDTGWFSKALTDSCQATWLAYEMRHVQSFSNSCGFLAAPGRLINNLYVGLGLVPDPSKVAVPDYRLAAHPLVAAAVARTWTPREPHPVLNAAPGRGRRLGQCPQSRFWRRRFRQLPAWSLRVDNSDPTSIYSWHITGPNGPEPVLYGVQALFLPTVAGSYSIELRQDNLGLPVETHGIRRVPLTAVPEATEDCVGPKVAR